MNTSLNLDIEPIIKRFESIDKAINEIKQLIINKPPEDELITRTEFLQTFNKSSTWLWQRIKDGEIPYIKMGRKIHFNKSEVIEYFKNKTRD
jgi:excisionase family DNA binding protein